MIPILLLLISCIYHAHSGSYPCLQSKLSPETDLCLLTVPKDVDSHKSTCDYYKFQLFSDRMDDELYMNFEKQFLELAKESGTQVYIGMTKDPGFNSKTWNFENDEGSIEQDDYAFWEKKPATEKCAVMRKNEAKVTPTDCRENRVGLCEKKDKGCYYTSGMFYAEFFGRCLSYSSGSDGYDKVKKNYCQDGYLMPVKDDDDLKAAEAALYMKYTHGIYAGLRKKDGKWIYVGKGIEETERLEDVGERECAFYGLKNGKITMFTADCRVPFGALCTRKTARAQA